MIFSPVTAFLKSGYPTAPDRRGDQAASLLLLRLASLPGAARTSLRLFLSGRLLRDRELVMDAPDPDDRKRLGLRQLLLLLSLHLTAEHDDTVVDVHINVRPFELVVPVQPVADIIPDLLVRLGDRRDTRAVAGGYP
jgi:hypothetical protein